RSTARKSAGDPRVGSARSRAPEALSQQRHQPPGQGRCEVSVLAPNLPWSDFMILITGGTGTSGRPIFQQAAAAPARVRVLVRTRAKAKDLRLPGVELVQGDFTDPVSLESACRGCERVLLNSSPAPELVRMQSQFIRAAKRAGVKHVVKFSVQDASPNAPYSF